MVCVSLGTGFPAFLLTLQPRHQTLGLLHTRGKRLRKCFRSFQLALYPLSDCFFSLELLLEDKEPVDQFSAPGSSVDAYSFEERH